MDNRKEQKLVDNEMELKKYLSESEMMELNLIRRQLRLTKQKVEENPSSFRKNIKYFGEYKLHMESFNRLMTPYYKKVIELDKRRPKIQKNRLVAFFYPEKRLDEEIKQQGHIISLARIYVKSNSLNVVRIEKSSIKRRKYEDCTDGGKEKFTITFSDDSSIALSDLYNEKELEKFKDEFTKTMTRLQKKESSLLSK